MKVSDTHRYIFDQIVENGFFNLKITEKKVTISAVKLSDYEDQEANAFFNSHRGKNLLLLPLSTVLNISQPKIVNILVTYSTGPSEEEIESESQYQVSKTPHTVHDLIIMLLEKQKQMGLGYSSELTYLGATFSSSGGILDIEISLFHPSD